MKKAKKGKDSLQRLLALDNRGVVVEVGRGCEALMQTDLAELREGRAVAAATVVPAVTPDAGDGSQQTKKRAKACCKQCLKLGVDLGLHIGCTNVSTKDAQRRGCAPTCAGLLSPQKCPARALVRDTIQAH